MKHKPHKTHKDKGTLARHLICCRSGMASAESRLRRIEVERNTPGHDHVYLFSKVTGDIDGCWNFTGCKNKEGYGSVHYRGKTWLAHRLSFFIVNGHLPDEMLVCHQCDNPSCINPQHLFLGTNRDNTMDAIRKGRKFIPNQKPQ